MNDAEQQADAIFRAVRSYIDDRIKHADADLNKWADEVHAKYDARIRALEEAPFEYTGVHETGKSYRRNQFVTHGGSMWAARCDTTQRPGDGNDWRLAVKKGADGR